MSNLLYELSIATMLRSLKTLDAILGKAEAHVEADDAIDPETLTGARLYPNMRPLTFQIQVATDTAKGAAARLTGTDAPTWPDDETTFADLHERIGKAVDYLEGLEPSAFDGLEDKEIVLELGPKPIVFDLTGTSYVSAFVLPNFYFHMTTAYNILRSNGVVLGKRDFLAGMGIPRS